MKNFSLSLLSMALLAGCAAMDPSLPSTEWKRENSGCEVPGNTQAWATSYCLWLSKTMDVEAPEIRNCQRTIEEHRSIPAGTCERNYYFKRELCKTLVLDGMFAGSLSRCLKSEQSVPLFVKEGGDSPR